MPKRHHRLLVALSLLLLALFVGLASLTHTEAQAQTPPEEKKAELRKKVEEKIATAREKMLRERVGLDEELAREVGDILQTLDQERFALRQQMKQEKKALKELIESGADDGVVEGALEKVLALQAQLDALKLEVNTRTQALLTATQRAKLLAVLPRFDKRIRRLVRKARKKARQGKRKRGKKRRRRTP